MLNAVARMRKTKAKVKAKENAVERGEELGDFDGLVGEGFVFFTRAC
jgi:hypothetical protein